MAEEWHGINDPGYFRKPANAEDKPKPKSAPDPVKPREPLAKEYKFKDLFIPEPAQGFELNKPFDIEGEIQSYGDKVVASKILLYPFGVYNGKEDNFAPGGIAASLNQTTWKFKATCKSLFEPDSFVRDENKPKDATWKLFVRAEGRAAEKPMESEKFTFPRASKFVELKKGDYDEDGAKKYNKPQSGDNFKPHGVVKSLQGDLIQIGFLPKDSDDGFFGDQTEKALKVFQEYAIKTERLKRSAGKTEKADKALDQKSADGIAGKKTRDELDMWLQKNWIKPILTLRKGDYDNNGTNTTDRQRGADNHHDGDYVIDWQRNLQKVEVYTDFALDGWFHNYMLEAVKHFQEAAEKGNFIVNGKPTDIGKKLTGHQKGILCPKTQEYLQDVIRQNGTVPKEDNAEFQLFVCTVYGEAAGCSEIAWRAIGHVIMNRLHDSGIKYFAPTNYKETVTAILTKSGFDAYTQRNTPFVNAESYFKKGKTPPNNNIDQLSNILNPIYLKKDSDITNGATLYYSPKAQAQFHKTNPTQYAEKPRWKFEQLEEAIIPGLNPDKDDFKFFKYK